MSNWISVKDDMPKDRQKVFVYSTDVEYEGPEMLSARCINPPRKREWTDWWNLPNGGYIYDVTHWMPRPDPPKDTP